MKAIRNTSLLIIVACMLNSCSSSKKIAEPASLYKTEEGRKIACKSYDKALELWDVQYEEEFVETDYGKSHVLISGKRNEEPLVLLPGLFADATMWYPNVKELSKYFKVYTLDMMNYGGKCCPSGKAIEDIADYEQWMKQLLHHYHIDRAAIAGLSYGSWLALALAREMPETITALVLLDPSETFMQMNGGIAWKGFKYFMFFPNRDKYEKFFDWMGGGYSDPKQDIWFEHMLDVIEYGRTKMFDIPQHRIYTYEELTMVQMPVLVMAGGKPILYDDPEVFRANALNALPHAEVVIVPGAGHGLNMEKAEYVNQQMITFLKSVD